MALAIPEAATGSPYRAILGEAFASLHPQVQRAHEAPLAGEGTLDVEHGPHWLAPLLSRIMRLPAAGRGQRARVDVAPAGAQVEWVRRIGSSVLRTRQEALGPLLAERQGMGRVAFALHVEDGALVYRQISMHVGGIMVPHVAAPRVEARVSPAGGGWRVEVTVTWRGRLICRYAGVLGLL